MKLKEVLPVLFVVKEDFVERMALTARAYGIYPQVKSFEVGPNVSAEVGIKAILKVEFGYEDDVEIDVVCRSRDFPHPAIGYSVALDKRGNVIAFINSWIKYSGPMREAKCIVHDFVYLK